MSKGMQQRLGIAQALIGEPKLLLRDGPTSALDPAGRRAIRGLLTGLRDRGIAGGFTSDARRSCTAPTEPVSNYTRFVSRR